MTNLSQGQSDSAGGAAVAVDDEGVVAALPAQGAAAAAASSPSVAAPVVTGPLTDASSASGSGGTGGGDNGGDGGAAAAVGAAYEDVAESYEQEHVHSVYESIAPHFSATRYKPWPVIASFLTSLEDGSVGIDVGCGNGKYLAVNPNVHIVGSDRSSNLVRIARDHGGRDRACDVAVADGLTLPFLPGRADFAICVAVIHHMSTRERRRQAVRALLDCVRPASSGGGGKVLVYVWALEQSNSRRGWDETADQDQLVPWVFKSKTKGEEDTTYQRYYHLYKKGELEEDIEAVGGRVVENGYDKDNWWAVGTPA
ncbi:S-adenosyl-L-methionine-dependent methyltransferase [Xylariales sp. PMI_506]|nr:S-adenosyl-L-methionine-dependent methyltransferase [Xylariales sp. PMI_506]